ncbi:MAG TPA: hypothetical protein VFN90_04290 [Gemmatimonadales bacterium]|nr:hypothetical protein [Gemmatimonadales bacterium]
MTGLRRVGLGAVIIGTLAQGIAYLLTLRGEAPQVAAWLMVAGIAAALAGTAWLGPASPHGSRWRVVGGLSILVVLLVGFGAALLLPGGATEPLWLGLPRRAAILLLGIGIFPVLLVPTAYALDFDATDLDDAGLAALRARAASARGSAE